jgi:hypothetical protein
MKVGPEQQERINARWHAKWEGVIEAQNQALNWLYALNGGGIAGILAYAAAKEAGACIVGALIAFVFGLLCLIGYAACMFYGEQRSYDEFVRDVKELYSGKIGWDEVWKREGARPHKYLICEVLAWCGGLAGCFGLVLSSYAIL